MQNNAENDARPVPRLSGRVILLDSADRFLLFRGTVSSAQPDRETWFLPGGGAEGSETPAQTAARELREETGLCVDATALGAPVALSRGLWNDGTVTYQAEDVFFLFRAPAWELSTAGFTDFEREQITDQRWWTLAELQATAATIFPRALAPLLTRLLAGERPMPPIELPW